MMRDMDLKTVGEQALESAKAYKLKTVSEHGPNSNFNPTVHVYRNGQLIAICQVASPVSSEKMQRLIDVVGPGLRADVLSVIFEGWVVGSDSPSKEINPDTGAEWEYGEMQAYVERHGRDGVVGDGFSLLVIDSSGDHLGASQPFTPVSGAFGWTVRWDEPMWLEPVEGSYVSGDIVAACRRAMAQNEEVTRMTRETMELGAREGMSLESMNADMDCVIAQTLLEIDLANVVLVCTEDEVERREAIAKAMGRPPVGNLREMFERASAPWN